MRSWSRERVCTQLTGYARRRLMTGGTTPLASSSSPSSGTRRLVNALASKGEE